MHRDQVRCALLTGAPHSHASAGELSADGRESPTRALQAMDRGVAVMDTF
ncbi:hypothetical protein [Rhodococcus globerulus]|nr:hypothetical protein [Rhodococcus globerulus]